MDEKPTDIIVAWMTLHPSNYLEIMEARGQILAYLCASGRVPQRVLADSWDGLVWAIAEAIKQWEQ